MALWGDEQPWLEVPEPAPEWRWIDVALIVAIFVILTALGVVTAGGPN